MTPPSVFVSYSHDDLDHKRWVLALSSRLRKSGVDVILDQWDLDAGDDLASFMTNNLYTSDRVIMVCTPNYVNKANKGSGGVGIERMILTTEYLANIDNKKVIPVIKQHGEKSVPMFFQTKRYIDFSRPDEYETSFDDLLRSILKKPLVEKPEIGESPFNKDIDEIPKATHDPVKDIMKLIASHYERTGSSCVTMERLHSSGVSSSRIMLDFIIKQAIERGYLSFDYLNDEVNLEHKGKQYALENNLI